MKNNSKGAHEWIVEFEKEPQDLELFSKLLDEELQKKIQIMKPNETQA